MSEEKEDEKRSPKYLTCERKEVYVLLMMTAGMMGAYTYNLRGGVFCNAQTANLMMMGVSFGKGDIRRGFYYLIPATAYFLGAFVSEALPVSVRRIRLFRWDTILVVLEMLTLFVVGFISLSAPHQIVQVAVNFIASMQYNTFRQAEGVPMATTFCTNHVRQVGIAAAKILRKGDAAAKTRVFIHLQMIGIFILGALILTVLCGPLQEKASWIILLPLGVILAQLVYADMVSERGELSRKPSGH